VRVDVRRGRDAGRVDGLQLFGVREDVGELLRKNVLFFVCQFEMRERGDTLDVGDGQRRGHVLDGTTAKYHGSMMRVRRPAVAGTWYPDNPARLTGELDAYLARVTVRPDAPPRAIVAPHAGLKYSGPVAAYAYSAARSSRPAAIVLVGPSHFVPFTGVSIWPAGAWETPLGQVQVDEDLASAIREAADDIVELEAAHGREHSLEMQLPFLAHLMPGVPIVPLVMGHQTRVTAFALSDVLARVVRAIAKDVLLVASSDLSHYEEAMVAADLDGVVMERVAALDAPGLMSELEHEPRHACGGGPMVAVLDAAARLGASTARILRYADSGDVSGDKSSVVGYMAAAIW
jgi:AmmeMemoRadiSam system protein B